jgi:hypothetical protein
MTVITADYLQARLDGVTHLFFLLTQDYLADNKKIAGSLTPILQEFGKKLGNAGTIVRPRKGTATDNLVRSTPSLPEHFKASIGRYTPALLIVDRPLTKFDPSLHPHVVASLRPFMDSKGDLDIFSTVDFLDALAEPAGMVSFFEQIKNYFSQEKSKLLRRALFNTVGLKPTVPIVGLGIDGKILGSVLRDQIQGQPWHSQGK